MLHDEAWNPIISSYYVQYYYSIATGEMHLQQSITLLSLIVTSNSLSTQNLESSRRSFVKSTAAILTCSGVQFTNVHDLSRNANAVETVGKDPDCNEQSCLGVWDGLLADCPHGKTKSLGAGCASSQDDTPGVFAEPWDYSDFSSLDYNDQMRTLIPAIQLVCSKRGDQVDILTQTGRYLRVLFKDGKTGEESIGEFYFTPNDTTVQFRVGSLNTSPSFVSSSLKNLDRCEMIRKQLRYTKIPVLRNRKRTLFFVESELDTFGPGYNPSLGPPAEMTTGELEGRQDVDPRMKIDTLQNFPLGGVMSGR